MITFDSTADAELAIKADGVCKAIGAALVKHYPHRQWYVDVSLKGGVVKILCPSVSMRFGFTLSIDRSAHDLEKAAVFAAGQILEMFKLSREKGAYGGEEKLLRDPRGEVIQSRTGL